MRHLDQLDRKCRHAPKMGGNTDTVTLPCPLVVRLIKMAQAWQYVNPANLTDIINSMDQELVWADDEAKASLERGVKVQRATL